MKKIIFSMFIMIGLNACTPPFIENNYKLEKIDGYEMPVCVNHPQTIKEIKSPEYDFGTCGRMVMTKPAEYEILDGECDILEPEIVSYDYCLANLPKKVFLVEKTKDGIKECYDINNKVELPILYCQKDMINIQNVNTYTSVVQRTNVSQRMTLY